jgi:hypothetical protein
MGILNLALYAQQRHIVIVNGIPYTGFADGDFLEVEQKGNAAEVTEGADGPSMNFSVAQGGSITLKLMPTSPLLGALYGLRDAQQSSPSLFSIIVMTGVEEVIRAKGCAFGTLPSLQTGGPKQAARTFLFNCLEIQLSVNAVEAVATI